MITARDGMKVSITRKGGTVLCISIMMGDISMISRPRKHVIGLLVCNVISRIDNRTI